MRWSQRLLIATAVISLFIILSFLSRNKNETPSYFPEEVQKFLHHDKSHEAPVDQTTQEFLQRPILSYEDAVRLNLASCPTEGVNFDEGNVRSREKEWRYIPDARISGWRHDIAAHLQERLHSETPAIRNGQGRRGVVMAAGDSEAAIRARTNIRFLRSYNSTLPVEIFHFSGELSAQDQSLLSDLSEASDGNGNNDNSVTVRAVRGIQKGNGWKAFQIKGPAIQQSSFDEILYLDTDSYLLRNPEFLFDGKHFQETGILLWPDYTKSHATNPLWRLVGQQCRNEYEGESGQVVISRSRHQDVLWLVEYFAVHHEVFYGFMGGDRDSFRVAALLLGKEWSGPGRLNAAAGVDLKDNPKGGGHTMLQSDPEGRWLFVHANLIKHGHFPRPLWKKIHRAAQDRYEGSSTYGSVDPPNNNLGEGVKLRVDQAPRLVTTMEALDGYDEALVVVEDWEAYEELRGFEEKWFGFGGVH